MKDKEKENKPEEEIVEEEAIEITDDEPIVIEDEPASIQKQSDEYKDMLQRLQAEFDNYRKRNNESVRIARNDGINDVIVAMLPVIDNFERGITAVADESAKNGMELILKQILALLSKFDVEEIVAMGEEFDPKYHHAIAKCDDQDNANKVVEVFQKGYKRKDKVLRAALVKVAQ